MQPAVLCQGSSSDPFRSVFRCKRGELEPRSYSILPTQTELTRCHPPICSLAAREVLSPTFSATSLTIGLSGCFYVDGGESPSWIGLRQQASEATCRPDREPGSRWSEYVSENGRKCGFKRFTSSLQQSAVKSRSKEEKTGRSSPAPPALHVQLDDSFLFAERGRLISLLTPDR